jgi:hypothetical protein
LNEIDADREDMKPIKVMIHVNVVLERPADWLRSSIAAIPPTEIIKIPMEAI